MASPAAGARSRRERIALALAAPVLAVVGAAVVTTLVLLVSGKNPLHAFQIMATYGTYSDSQVYILDRATTYYLSGLAVAVGFRMNLFNIGVDGQYRMAAFFAAVVGGAVALPGPLQILVIILVAMLVGAAWSGIAAVLKTTRGVSEVISSIMLNAIATSVIAYLLNPSRLASKASLGSNNLTTPPIPAAGRFPSINTVGGPLWGFLFVAVLVGIVYHLLLTRTRFGFDLRTTGASETAALAGGVDVKRMVLSTMLLSGAIAGLVGMPQLLNDSYQYSLDFPAGIGFTGIAVALLGRNHPVGIAVGALLWAFLDRTGGQLDFQGYDQEIVGIIQGTIVICVVVAYEVVRRYGLRRQQRAVGEHLGRTRTGGPTTQAQEATS
ncbi:ABC transporter permease [Phaeacidiphilus oryzae]|uniref:ABC transporter permease n=1 Tax=Phaeacidiphilus oryzae TaxID=348818 RepID=UPI00055B01D9|nr:ABC transporter permease [Phaeacidiphilus oryzae]